MVNRNELMWRDDDLSLYTNNFFTAYRAETHHKLDVGKYNIKVITLDSTDTKQTYPDIRQKQII